MNKEYYTDDKKHPEDVIYEIKKFINELTKIQENYFCNLVDNLKINKEGEDWLFDYIHNGNEEENKMTFEEYLYSYGKTYKDFLDKDIEFICADELMNTESNFQYSEEVESAFEDDVLK